MKIIFRISVVGIFLILIGKFIVLPKIAYELYKEEYMDLVLNCAFAMDSNWYIEQQNNLELKTASNIELIICHEYDLARKQMLIYGVSKEELAYLGLKALEIDQIPIDKLVEQHKFKKR